MKSDEELAELLIPLCLEGAPCHPDKFLFVGTDEAYLHRLQAYADRFGIEETKRTICSRPYLLEKLK